MGHSLYKVLHKYIPNPKVTFEKVDVLVYQDALVLAGYQSSNGPLSAFVHYEFADLGLPGIYSMQLQMMEQDIPEIFKKAKTNRVFHAEPKFVLVPNSQLNDVPGFKVYADAYADAAEKLMSDDIACIGAREYYNYPFRVFNDVNNVFLNSEYHSYHNGLFNNMIKESGKNVNVYISIKSKHVEISFFKDQNVQFINTFSFSNHTEIIKFVEATFKEMNLDLSHEYVYATCIQKDHVEEMMNMLKSKLKNVNSKATANFGIPIEIWSIYADLFMAH
jgi:hypothetical protein